MSFRRISVNRTGDIIKVKLVDNYFKIYFKGKANINNPKEMERLKEELRQKGVSL